MKKWLDEVKAMPEKIPMPILSFPSASLLGVSVKELLSSAEMQAKGMKAVADRHKTLAAVSMMDLSIEAEAFGATIRASEDEVPTVIGAMVASEEEARALPLPTLNAGRCLQSVEAIRLAKQQITDRPVLAGVIGPFSLAGRLMDVSEALMNCYVEPDMVHVTLEKAMAFLIDYIKAYRAAGADGVVMAEPLAGMLSPALVDEFSSTYVKQIVDAVQTDDFIVIYHNCGDNVALMTDSILSTGAAAYHFGNAVSMKEMLEKIPADTVVMGNVDPAGQFLRGTADSICEETVRIMSECCVNPNFVISSGCDIPPLAPWENIDAFFAAAKDFYSKD